MAKDCVVINNFEPIAESVGRILIRFPEVKWDRFSGQPYRFMVFGWIEREDDHEDFVSLLIENLEVTQIMTSSATYSRLFSERVGEQHSDCHRVEDVFKDVNSIKLKKGK